MRIIRIFLPLADAEGRRFPPGLYACVRRELTEKFGGLTAFTRAPAEGLWVDKKEDVVRDNIVIFEVIAENGDADWWAMYRRGLEALFRQDKILILAQAARVL